MIVLSLSLAHLLKAYCIFLSKARCIKLQMSVNYVMIFLYTALLFFLKKKGMI